MDIKSVLCPCVLAARVLVNDVIHCSDSAHASGTLEIVCDAPLKDCNYDSDSGRSLLLYSVPMSTAVEFAHCSQTRESDTPNPWHAGHEFH